MFKTLILSTSLLCATALFADIDRNIIKADLIQKFADNGYLINNAKIEYSLNPFSYIRESLFEALKDGDQSVFIAYFDIDILGNTKTVECLIDTTDNSVETVGLCELDGQIELDINLN